MYDLFIHEFNLIIVSSCSISTILREADNSAIADSNRSSRQLQRRSLGALSPDHTGVKQDKVNKVTPQPAPKPGKKQSITEKDPPRTPNASSVAPNVDGPARRIRRPTMIRRPKLIGKSVEGAAMQAVAASRKRASTNQFKNRTNPAQGVNAPVVRQPTIKESTNPRTSSTVAADRPVTRTVQKRKEENDETLVRVRKDFELLCSEKRKQLLRISSRQQEARLSLANIWLPRVPSHFIPISIAEFLTSIAPKAWDDVCSLPPLPGGVKDIFLPTIARWIVALNPGLELLSVQSSPNKTDGQKMQNSVFLASTIRNVRGSKCCAISRISMLDSTSSRQRVPTVKIQGWLLNLPRRAKTPRRLKLDSPSKCSFPIEKDSTGMDLLLTQTHVSSTLH